MFKTLVALVAGHKIIALLAIIGLVIWFWRMLKSADKVIGDEDYTSYIWIGNFVKLFLMSIVIIALAALFVVSLF